MGLCIGDIVRISYNGPGHIAGKLAEVQFDYPVCANPDTTIVVNIQNEGIDHVMLKHIEPLKDPSIQTDYASVSEGGSLRYNKGKPEFSHLSPDFIMEMMKTMTKSNEKYPYLNYTKKQDVKTASDSLMRHYLAFQMGQNLDDDTSCHHLAHLAVNAMIIFQNLKDYGDEVDNRYSVAKEKVQNGD